MGRKKRYDKSSVSHELTPYERLANAIIITAAADYRIALRKCKANPNNHLAQSDVAEIERFFRSSWYKALTTVDGEMILQKIREEVSDL